MYSCNHGLAGVLQSLNHLPNFPILQISVKNRSSLTGGVSYFLSTYLCQTVSQAPDVQSSLLPSEVAVG